MSKTTPTGKATRIACSTCSGTGQISFFQGVSRFVISWEECPECSGTGFVETTDTQKGKEEPSAKKHSS